MMSKNQTSGISRRVVIRSSAAVALSALLAACGSSPPTPTPLPSRGFVQTQVALSPGFAVSTFAATPINATAPVDLSGRLSAVGMNFALLPSDDPMRALNDHSEILAFLRTALGKPVVGKAPVNYTMVMDALVKRTVDIAHLSPFAYLLASQRGLVEPLIQGEASDGMPATSRTFLIVLASSSIAAGNLAGLRGTTIAFSEPTALGGYLVPAYSVLKNAGLKANTDYKADFRGTAAAIYQAVLSGAAAAGAIPFTDFDDGVAKGQINKDQLHVIDTSFDYPGNLIAARTALPAGDREIIQSVFLALSNQPRNAKVLSQFVLSPPQGTGSFGGVTVKVRKAADRMYDTIRDIPRALGITLESIVK